MYIKVEGNPNLVRDSQSKAILNTNKDALNGYRRERVQRKRLAQMIRDHDKIKEELDHIKDMLAVLLEKVS